MRVKLRRLKDLYCEFGAFNPYTRPLAYDFPCVPFGCNEEMMKFFGKEVTMIKADARSDGFRIKEDSSWSVYHTRLIDSNTPYDSTSDYVKEPIFSKFDMPF